MFLADRKKIEYSKETAYRSCLLFYVHEVCMKTTGEVANDRCALRQQAAPGNIHKVSTWVY